MDQIGPHSYRDRSFQPPDDGLDDEVMTPERALHSVANRLQSGLLNRADVAGELERLLADYPSNVLSEATYEAFLTALEHVDRRQAAAKLRDLARSL